MKIKHCKFGINLSHYRNSYIEKMAKRLNDEIVPEEIKNVKSDTENINNPDEIDKFLDAKAENSFYYLKKTYNEHDEKKFKEEYIENNTNLDCENGVVNGILTKTAEKNQGKHSNE